jgi:guanylate kinase
MYFKGDWWIMSGENNLQNKGLIIAISGPSGVGKGSVIDKVKELSRNIIHSVSATTRSPRPGETDGVQYRFVDIKSFEDMLEKGEILEHDYYCGNYYGTPRAPLVRAVDEGKDVILDITVPGSLTLMEKIPDIVSVFLLPPSFKELAGRLVKRGTEDDKVAGVRLEKARDEIKMTEKFEYVIVNDDLDRTAQKILTIIEAEKSKYRRLRGIERALLEEKGKEKT